MASGLRSSLRALAHSATDFIVVGDIAAALRGAPLGGFDFSVVVRAMPPAPPPGMVRILLTAGRGRSFDDLLPDSTVLEVEPGLPLRVANLESVIAIKEELATPVDMAALPTLRATLAEIRRLQASPSTTSE